MSKPKNVQDVTIDDLPMNEPVLKWKRGLSAQQLSNVMSAGDYCPKAKTTEDFKGCVDPEFAAVHTNLLNMLVQDTSICPIVSIYKKRKEDEEFAMDYLRDYAHLNGVTLDQAAINIISFTFLDNNVKKHIVKLFEDKVF